MPPDHGRSTWPAAVALLAYAVAFAFLGDRAPGAPSAAAPGSTPAAGALVGLVRDAALAGVAELALFLPLGFLSVLAMPRRAGRLDRCFRVFLPGVLAAGALAAGVVGYGHGRPWSFPGALELALPLAGCLLGAWLGLAWTRGWSARLWLLPKLAFLLALAAGGGAALVYLASDTAPLEFEHTSPTSAERRRLYRMFQEKNPAKLSAGQTAELRLSARDLDLLLAWGLSLAGPGRKAQVELEPDVSRLALSLRLPSGQARYLNVIAGADLRVEDGRPSVFAHQLRIGRIELPASFLGVVTPLAVAAVAGDRRVKPLLAPIHSLETGPGSLTVRYGRAEPPSGFLADLFRGEGAAEADIPAVQAHLRHLIQAAKGLPREGDARFSACLETAFRHARERSRTAEAVRENRAAILALGMLLGHWRVETLVGRVTDDATLQKAVRAFRGTTLRGRDDWTKHFFVSASLSALAVGSLSDAAGILKEELDAGGGSGFSFGDLLADRAGTTLAATATRDEQTARAFQARLADGVVVDDVFPSAAGLPEGLQDAELRARYGGVDGAGYRRLVDEIERRLATCGAYRL
jgi:hypothetical protein